MTPRATAVIKCPLQYEGRYQEFYDAALKDFPMSEITQMQIRQYRLYAEYPPVEFMACDVNDDLCRFLTWKMESTVAYIRSVDYVHSRIGYELTPDAKRKFPVLAAHIEQCPDASDIYFVPRILCIRSGDITDPFADPFADAVIGARIYGFDLCCDADKQKLYFGTQS